MNRCFSCNVRWGTGRGGLSNSLLPAKSSAIQSLLSCLRAASSLLVASVWARVNIRSMRYIDRVRLYIYTYYINYPYCLCPPVSSTLLYVHSVVRLYPLRSPPPPRHSTVSHSYTSFSLSHITRMCIQSPSHIHISNPPSHSIHHHSPDKIFYIYIILTYINTYIRDMCCCRR